MHTTHTAQHLNSRHHQHGTQVTDRDGDTWTRVKTSHGTYWEHDGSRCRNLPKLYEPYTYSSWKETVDAWKEAFNTEPAEHVDAYLNAEKLHGQGTTNPPQPQSRGLFQTIPSTWTKPTNLLPKPTPTNTHNMLKAAQHIFGIDTATGNTGHGIRLGDYYHFYNANPDSQHVHWAPNQKQISIEHNPTHPTRTPKIQGMTATHTTTDTSANTSAPFIIAIEGIDGAGKNTTTKQLAQLLNATTITFPQYGKTQAAHQITQHLKTGTLNPWHAAQLFAQDRAQTPLPTTGTIIIDRYTASNAAYLTAKTGDPNALQAIEDLEFNTLKLPKPHLHILIDTPVDTAMHRTKQRANTHGEEPDTNETDRELQHKVRETYLNMAQTNWVSPWLIITPQTTKD